MSVCGAGNVHKDLDTEERRMWTKLKYLEIHVIIRVLPICTFSEKG